jgi:hypothetical protein
MEGIPDRRERTDPVLELPKIEEIRMISQIFMG